MTDKKAFLVTRGATTVGYLGTGPGPFVSLVHSSLPNPWLDAVRFTCRTRSDEARVSEVLAGATSLATAEQELRALGYVLTAVPFEDYFAAPEDSASLDPARESGRPR